MTIDIETLRSVPLFASVEEPAMFGLLGAVEQTFPRGAVVVRAHEPARSICVVREGGVKEVQLTPEGKEVILGLLGPGELVGDVVSSGDTAPVTVTTVLPSRILLLPRDEWARLVESSPALERSLNALLQRRLDDAWRMVRMLSRYTTEARLKSALVILAERWGQPREEGIEIGIELTHRTLADFTGASREKVTRALGVLSRKGLVQVLHRRLVVPSLDRLMAE